MTDIFMIRHGEPLWNTGIAYRTMPGPDLSDKGRHEARQVAAFLAARAVEHLFVSPFARTTQTAEQIIEQINIPITFTRLLEENAPDEHAARVDARIREFLSGVADSPYRRIALVSHGYPIRVLLKALSQDQLDLTAHVYAGNNPAPTAGVWHAQRSDPSWQLELVFKPQ